MPECEWDDDLPGEPCGAGDSPAEATASREVAWSNRIWGGEGEDWTETTHLCAAHAAALDSAIAARKVTDRMQAEAP